MLKIKKPIIKQLCLIFINDEEVGRIARYSAYYELSFPYLSQENTWKEFKRIFEKDYCKPEQDYWPTDNQIIQCYEEVQKLMKHANN